ncbi:hypothetical protein LJC22_01960 [Desulfosarcina sp. OttesenSCG-928-G10]|nr:hypothetical protein [Desulfosarcina sp. OttesenSCG-928-G10]MDL2321487.1 hypothetical protein [Desulfosarcina sp. OttesenSCG-928-B08]
MDSKKDIAELLKQDGLVLEAIRKGSREAMKQYIQAGQSMVSWKDGKIEMIPPEELKKMIEENDC